MQNEDEEKCVLQMAYDYFKLLAQQRVTHFNLFLVFIGVITTVLLSNIHANAKGNIIACTLSFIQVFLCFIFHKIDLRNKYLIKHTENIIKSIEGNYKNTNHRIFRLEEKRTNDLRAAERKKIYFSRQLSTSQLYNLFYFFFLFAGFIGLVLSVFFIATGK
ncbi:MAG: hypothetical protein PHC69_09415 [Ruminiclostridium sp.]|nr:hypothetical protein [Ruminiclostridium sp.]